MCAFQGTQGEEIGAHRFVVDANAQKNGTPAASREPLVRVYSNVFFFSVPLYLPTLVREKKREIDKIGYTRVVSEQNRVPFFSQRGALTHVCKTPPKRVLAPEPTTPCVRAAPRTVFSVFDPSKQRQ